MNSVKPYIKIIYDAKDITRDVSEYLETFGYTDNQSGKADEIALLFDDSEGLWRGQWYPQKGDLIEVDFGYENLNVSAGVFEIDEIGISGMPAKLSLRAISASTSKSLRSATSSAHEKKTLRQIAEFIAQKNGLQVVGDIEQISIERTTQNRETDLGFLCRIAKEYGYVFSVRGNQLIFTNVYELESSQAVETLDITQVSNYSFTDKLVGTVQKAKSAYINQDSGNLVEAESLDSEGATSETALDTAIVRTKAENKKQAEAKAKASAYFANTAGQTGRLVCAGSPLLLAGNNITLTGFGALNGKYQITKSTHSISVSSGYKTNIEIKRVGL